MKSVEYYLGLVAGVAVVAVLVLLAGRKQKKTEPQAKYDERQLVARGKAYKSGFLGMLIADAVAIIVSSAFEISWLSPAVLFSVAALIGIGIFCVSAINNDAYFGFNQNIKTSGRFLIFIGGLNLIIGIASLIRGGVIVDGSMNGSLINLLMGILFIVIYAVILIHDRKNAESEGEE